MAQNPLGTGFSTRLAPEQTPESQQKKGVDFLETAVRKHSFEKELIPGQQTAIAHHPHSNAPAILTKGRQFSPNYVKKLPRNNQSPNPSSPPQLRRPQPTTTAQQPKMRPVMHHVSPQTPPPQFETFHKKPQQQQRPQAVPTQPPLLPNSYPIQQQFGQRAPPQGTMQRFTGAAGRPLVTAGPPILQKRPLSPPQRPHPVSPPAHPTHHSPFNARTTRSPPLQARPKQMPHDFYEIDPHKGHVAQLVEHFQCISTPTEVENLTTGRALSPRVIHRDLNTEAAAAASIISTPQKDLKPQFAPSTKHPLKASQPKIEEKAFLSTTDAILTSSDNYKLPSLDRQIISKASPALLRLQSSLSDDGYNQISPIDEQMTMDRLDAVSSSEQNKIKKASIYDWATTQSISEQDSNHGDVVSDDPLMRSPSNRRFSVAGVIRRAVEGGVNRHLSQQPINVFVGSWNTEYGEFPLTASLASCPPLTMKVDKPATVPENVVSTGILVGTTEEDSKKIRELILSEAQPPPDDTNGGNEDDEHEPDDSESDVEGDVLSTDPQKMELYRSMYAPPSKARVKAQRVVQPAPDHLEPFAAWIPSGYDVYVIALQEVTSDRIFEAMVLYLSRINKKKYIKMKFTEDKISGLGDGAYLTMKSTAIGCFVAADVSGYNKPVYVGSSKGMSLNSLNGSKGAVSIILTIYDQIICFVSCHLPTGKADGRIKAREIIKKRLAEAYCGFQGVDPTDVFHHIVWAGDFNLRVQQMNASSVLDFLYKGDYKSVLAFDEFQYSNFNADFAKEGYEEPEITFLPTYKKIVGRGIMSKMTDPFWLHKEYNVNFQVRWYKGGKIKERVPSWTDRVFKWSHPELKSCFLFIPNTYKDAIPNYDSILLQSDHTPVGSGLALYPLASHLKLPPIMFYEGKRKPSSDM